MKLETFEGRAAAISMCLCDLPLGLPFMTSALKGGGGPGKADEVREASKCGQGGRGIKKIQTFCVRHKWKPPFSVISRKQLNNVNRVRLKGFS